jgi:hypothetical protein
VAYIYKYKSPYEEASVAAHDEYVRCEQRLSEIQAEAATLTQRMQELAAYINAVRPLIQNDPGKSLNETGLTEICRDVLSRAGRWVTAEEVRQMLSQVGIDISGYTNPMAVLHSILKRIGPSVKSQTDGRVFYGDAKVVGPLAIPR